MNNSLLNKIKPKRSRIKMHIKLFVIFLLIFILIPVTLNIVNSVDGHCQLHKCNLENNSVNNQFMNKATPDYQIKILTTIAPVMNECKTIVGPNNIQLNLGSEDYICEFNSGNRTQSSDFSYSNIGSVTNKNENTVAELSSFPNDQNSFAPLSSYLVISGIALGNYLSLQYDFATNNTPSTTFISDTFSIMTPRTLGIFFVIAGGKQNFSLRGICSIHINESTPNNQSKLALSLTHGYFNKFISITLNNTGNYTIFENTHQCAGEQNPNNVVDLKGVFIVLHFTQSLSNKANSSQITDINNIQSKKSSLFNNSMLDNKSDIFILIGLLTLFLLVNGMVFFASPERRENFISNMTMDNIKELVISNFRFANDGISIKDLSGFFIALTSIIFFIYSIFALTGQPLNITNSIIILFVGTLINLDRVINSLRLIFQKFLTASAWSITLFSIYFISLNITKIKSGNYFNPSLNLFGFLIISILIFILGCIWIVMRQRKTKKIKKYIKIYPNNWNKPVTELYNDIRLKITYFKNQIVDDSKLIGIIAFILLAIGVYVGLMINNLFLGLIGVFLAIFLVIGLLIYVYLFIAIFTLPFKVLQIIIGYHQYDDLYLVIGQPYPNDTGITFKSIYSRVFNIGIELGLVNFAVVTSLHSISIQNVIYFEVGILLLQLLPEKIRNLFIFGLYDLIVKDMEIIFIKLRILREENI